MDEVSDTIHLAFDHSHCFRLQAWGVPDVRLPHRPVKPDECKDYRDEAESDYKWVRPSTRYWFRFGCLNDVVVLIRLRRVTNGGSFSVFGDLDLMLLPLPKPLRLLPLPLVPRSISNHASKSILCKISILIAS